MQIEICTNSFSSAKIAASAGAQRIELCQALEIGGLSPSFADITLSLELKQVFDLEVYVLIRSRPGDFSYRSEELKVMQRDIEHCKALGVDGVVIGALTRDRRIDTRALNRLITAAQGMGRTFHRAFDFVVDPHLATQQLIDLGVKTILTSGQQKKVKTGIPLLSELQDRFGHQIEFMAGGGVREANVVQVLESTGLQAVHASASAPASISDLPHSRTDISYKYKETKLDWVRNLRRAIDTSVL
ncbi:MAG: copper homeostasis protein CutC [Bacteroidota bacterium]